MKLILSVILSFICYTCYCQEPPFLVIDMTGNVLLKKQNKKALIGTGVKENEIIIVAKKSSITLSCKNSGYVRFSTPGTYIVNSINSCQPVKNNDFARICKFAWKQYNEHGNDWRNEIDNMAAASREICFVKLDQNLADINYCNGDFSIAYTPSVTGKSLSLKIANDIYTVPLTEIPLEKNQFPLSIIKNTLPDTGTYFWHIAPHDEKCQERFKLHIVSKEYRDSVVKSLTNSIGTFITNKAQQQYLLGILLENKHFFADAFLCYKQAIKLGSGEKIYLSEVAAFKKRYNMN